MDKIIGINKANVTFVEVEEVAGKPFLLHVNFVGGGLTTIACETRTKVNETFEALELVADSNQLVTKKWLIGKLGISGQIPSDEELKKYFEGVGKSLPDHFFEE